jgi:hypothetical protein
MYRLTLRPLPGPVPPHIRLRQLLKRALRSCGLRCTTLEELPDATPPEPAPAAESADHAEHNAQKR